VNVLAALKPGAEAQLRGVLRAIGDDIKGKRRDSAPARAHIDFNASRAIHFARFAILNDPDSGPGQQRLLYAAVYDGTLENHLAELTRIASDMDAIWGACEGYSGVAGFADFIAQRTQPAEAFYIAFRHHTVTSIHKAITHRRGLQDAHEYTALPAMDMHLTLGEILRRIVRALPLPIDGARAIFRLGFGTVFRAVRRITVGLNRYWYFRWFNWLTRNRMAPLQSPYSSIVLDNFAAPAPLVPGDEIASSEPPSFREDVVTQNQLTLVTPLDPTKVDNVRAVMAAIDGFSKRLTPPGSLIGIATIHFVRWMLIDNGRRLLMVSDYDGSWESYIDEFAEMILSGLEAIWENALGFPPAGARDLPAFKRFLRNHQVPSEIFFARIRKRRCLICGMTRRWWRAKHNHLIMLTASTIPAPILKDIQGLITSGYGHLHHTAYWFVRLEHAAGAREWLRQLGPTITTAKPWALDSRGKPIKPASAINLALSASGLAACGLPENVLRTFPPEFVEGMAAESRARLLGDEGDNASAHWEIGGPNNEPHALLILHANDEAALAAACEAQRALLSAPQIGARLITHGEQYAYRPQSDCEPFGFRDGIAQPRIRGFNDSGGASVPAGEFILGHKNHYALIAPTPVVGGELDPQNLLPPLANPYHAGKHWRDLGRNGSYLVYRKLQQNVAGFWQFMKREAERIDGRAEPARMIWVAAKCVGRWPSGAPLALTPNADDARLANRDDFLYAGDAHGFACPMGAHVRRTNPRDMLPPYPAQQSLNMSKAHRILRRGRVYGAPLFDPMWLQRALTDTERDQLLNLTDDGTPRGIHFLCVNASIKSQFEFIQQSWCNNPRFGALNDNPDPLLGNALPDQAPSRMSIPGKPKGIRTAELPHFVTVRGGGYFFVPSLAAMRFMGALAV